MATETRLEPRLRTAIEHLLGAHPGMGHLRERLARLRQQGVLPEPLEVERTSWPTE
jgi:plasmid stabilization system protein ParE